MRAGPSAARSPWRAILPDLTALRVRDYRLLWLGMLATSALMPVQFITQVLWVQEVAGESTRLLLAGVLGAARGGAMLLTSVISGALADRMDRRRLLLIAPCLGFLVNGAIALLMLRGEGGAGTLTLFFLLSFAAGAVLSIDAPARQAMIPQIVGREHLGNAVALDAVAVQLAFPLGPLLAGFLIAEVSFGGAYLAGTLGYIIVFLCVLRMRYRGPGG